SGNAFVGGHTNSSQSTFPVKSGPDLTYNGGGDAFAAEVASNWISLVYCGYVGGAGKETGWALAIDAQRNAFLTGGTESTQSSFPVKVGPDLTYNGGGDAFIAKVVP